MDDAPELTTDRLRLRAFRRDDFDWYADLWADPAVVRFIGGVPRTRSECWMRFLMNFGMWRVEGCGFWLIEDRADGRPLGSGGVFRALRGIAEVDAYPEAGWALCPAAFGRGFADEAMTAILAWTDANVSAPQTGCIIEPGNAASLRIAARLGYRAAGMATLNACAIAVFARPRGG